MAPDRTKNPDTSPERSRSLPPRSSDCASTATCSPVNPVDLLLSDFSPFSLTDPPHIYPGIYVLQNEEEILYIGESGSLPRRLRQHHKKPWWPNVTEVLSWWCPDPEDRLVGETVMILRERPRHNRAIKLGLDSRGRVYPIHWR